MDSQKFYYSISFQYREIIYFLNTFVFKPCSLQPQHLLKFASRQQQCEALLPLILCIEILLIKIESEDGGAIKSGNFSQNFRKANNLESMLSEAYADDLTLITHNDVDMQTAVDLTTRWLKWTETMKAKPSKCISLGFKLFDKKINT